MPPFLKMPNPMRKAGILLAVLLGAACLSANARAAGVWQGNFDTGLGPWTAGGGGTQCANWGLPSAPPRLRGNLTFDSSIAGEGAVSGRFDLPPSQGSTYPLEACELLHWNNNSLGADDYYGFMFYVPVGWTDGTDSSASFWGVSIAQFHFQNIWAAPIVFELHNTHVTLAMETGACNDYLTTDPGCTWRSNADNPGSDPGNLGAQYVVPPPMQQGVWHEVVMHVHWAADTSGQVQVWTRAEGQTPWTQTASLSGIPTVQWDVSTGCCASAAVDKIGAYRGPANTPVSVWEDNYILGTDFASVAALMPMAPAPIPVTTGIPAGTTTGVSGHAVAVSKPPSVCVTPPRVKPQRAKPQRAKPQHHRARGKAARTGGHQVKKRPRHGRVVRRHPVYRAVCTAPASR